MSSTDKLGQNRQIGQKYSHFMSKQRLMVFKLQRQIHIWRCANSPWCACSISVSSSQYWLAAKSVYCFLLSSSLHHYKQPLILSWHKAHWHCTRSWKHSAVFLHRCFSLTTHLYQKNWARSLLIQLWQDFASVFVFKLTETKMVLASEQICVCVCVSKTYSKQMEDEQCYINNKPGN